MIALRSACLPHLRNRVVRRTRWRPSIARRCWQRSSISQVRRRSWKPRVSVGARPHRSQSRYARGLMAAQEAFRQGGSFESLAPVRQAIAGLDVISRGRPGAAAVARLVLQAASAAAQSELGEMRLYLESAIQMESLQRAGQPGVPLVSAGETAGSCGCSCTATTTLVGRMSRHVRRRAAQRGCSLVSDVRQRLQDTDTACAAFRELLELWNARPARPSQIAEAQAHAADCASRPVAAADTCMHRYRLTCWRNSVRTASSQSLPRHGLRPRLPERFDAATSCGACAIGWFAGRLQNRTITRTSSRSDAATRCCR